jgi:alpha-galactosidase
MAVKYTIHPDGSFDILTSCVQLLQAYPSIDGHPLRPTHVRIDSDFVEYELDTSRLRLDFSYSGDELCISTRIANASDIHTISPIDAAHLVGATRAFRQGFGMGGPSGLVSLEECPLKSYGLIALGDTQFMTLHAVDHTRFNHSYCVSRVVAWQGAIESIYLRTDFALECSTMGEVRLPDVYVSQTVTLQDGLSACAQTIADYMGARREHWAEFYWCSWYYLYHNLDQKLLEEYLDGFRVHRDDAPISHVQIDAGYFNSPGDWLKPCARFSQGMSYAADMIRNAGFEPGIWVAPFMVGSESELARRHPEWLLRYTDGSLCVPRKAYNEPKHWGYHDCEIYVLDTSHPEALAYLKDVFSTFRTQGYTLFKTDFLLYGIQDSSRVIRHTPGKTSIEYFRDAMYTIREAMGNESIWLGCIAPFLPMIGFADMMRIAGDVGAQWEDTGFGPTNMIREVVSDHYFNRVYWLNDPDAVLLRDFYTHLKPREIEGIALFQALAGGLITMSDPLHRLSDNSLTLLRMIVPHGVSVPEYPFWEDGGNEIVIMHTLPQGKIIFFFNPGHYDITRAVDFASLVGEEYTYATAWGAETQRMHEIHTVNIPRHDYVLFFITREPLKHMPKNLWRW